MVEFMLLHSHIPFLHNAAYCTDTFGELFVVSAPSTWTSPSPTITVSIFAGKGTLLSILKKVVQNIPYAQAPCCVPLDAKPANILTVIVGEGDVKVDRADTTNKALAHMECSELLFF